MGLKEDMKTAADNVKHAAKHAVEDVKDAVNEGKHRSEAEAEHAKREVAGDELTPGEYADSVAKESVSRVQGGLDHAKRNVRDTVD